MPEEKKGLGKWAWAAIGCGGLVVVVLVVLVVGGYFAWDMVKEAGFDPELWEKDPAGAAAKMLTTLNPDLEVVSSDSEAGTITVRDKETGEEMTIRLDDIRQGRIEFERGGEKVTIDSSEGAEGGMTITTEEGTVQVGGHAGDRPDWVPVYPSAEVENLMSQVQEGKRSGMLGQETSDSLESVIEEMRRQLEEQGFEIKESKVEIQGELLQLHLDATDAQGRKVSVVASRRDEGGTSLMIQYEQRE